MSYPHEAHRKKPSYFRTLPDTIAQSPTGIAKIPNSRFPVIAPLNPTTFKSVYERAGFEVYKPPSGQRLTSSSNDKISPKHDGYRSQSTSILQSFERSNDGVKALSKRNASELSKSSHIASTTPITSRPPAPELRIDANLANSKCADSSISNSRNEETLGTPTSATSAPVDRSQPLSGQQAPRPARTATEPSFSSTRPGVLPYQNRTAPGSTLPQSTTSSRFNVSSQRQVPPSATSSKFDIRSDSTVSSGRDDGPESVYMSTQSLPQSTTSNSSLSLKNENNTQNASKSTNAAAAAAAAAAATIPQMVPKGIPPPASSFMYGKSYESISNSKTPRHVGSTVTASSFSSTFSEDVLAQKSDGTKVLPDVNQAPPRVQPYSARFAQNGTGYGSDAPQNFQSFASKDLPELDVLSSSEKTSLPFPGDLSVEDDYSFDMTNQSTGTVKYVPRMREITSDISSDTSDEELNLSSEDESDDESMKSAILSPNPQGRASSTPRTQAVTGLDKTTVDTNVTPPAHTTLPSFTINDPNGNVMDADFAQSPMFKNIMRTSTASSVYTADFSQGVKSFGDSPMTSGGFDDQNLPNGKYEDQYEDQYEDSNATVFEEVENQLVNLTMNSMNSYNTSKNSFDFTRDNSTERTAERDIEPLPLNIKMHSVKEASTEIEKTFNGEKRLLNEQSLRKPDPAADKTTDSPIQDVNSIPGFKEDVEPLCITKQAKPKHSPGDGPCRKCGLEITTKPIYSKSGELSGQWHRPCFTCTLCDLRFSKNINCFVLQDEPYCEYHYHLTNKSLCQVCGTGIVGKCLENDAMDRYHVDCLRCTKCMSHINSDYLSINGMVYCEPCAEEYTHSQNLGTGLATGNIERRRTRLYFI